MILGSTQNLEPNSASTESTRVTAPPSNEIHIDVQSNENSEQISYKARVFCQIFSDRKSKNKTEGEQLPSGLDTNESQPLLKGKRDLNASIDPKTRPISTEYGCEGLG